MQDEVIKILGEVLQLGERTKLLTSDTPLLGNIPELDSMAVVSIITAMEDYFGFIVDDDEISAETFSNVETLTQFVQGKM